MPEKDLVSKIADEAIGLVVQDTNLFKIEFFAMGSNCFIVVADATSILLEPLRKYVDKLESLWSRFINTSELMLANNASGNIQSVSPETIRLIQEMQFGFQLTSGIFNPAQLHVSLEHGFSKSKFDADQETHLSEHVSADLGVLDIVIDALENTIQIPLGVAIDAGGIGKGLAADMTADLAIQLGAQGVVVFIGGEVCVRGLAPGNDGWTIGVSHPLSRNEFIDVLAIHDGGVATSGPRGWINAAGESHIIDSRTHEPVLSEILQVTVVASCSAHAEILTKLCMALPISEAISEVERIGADALLIDDKLKRYATASWENYTT